MKFPPNIKIPDSLKGVFKKSSTPDPLRETRRNPKDNIPLNFRERSNARVSLMASVIVLAILVLFFNQLDYRLIRKPAIDAQKKATAVKAKADQEAADTTAETTTASVIAVGDNQLELRQDLHPHPGRHQGRRHQNDRSGNRLHNRP